LTQTFTAHCNAMICQQVTLLGNAEWPKVAAAVIEAGFSLSSCNIWSELVMVKAELPIVRPPTVSSLEHSE
jgi:hypothetical protein